MAGDPLVRRLHRLGRWPSPQAVGVAVRLTAAAVVVRRLAGAGRRVAPLEAAPADARIPAISVVIPARDEEYRLGPCLAALAGARSVVELIVVDDQSSDSTAAVAHAYGATVVSGAALPEGWAGKCWALQQGFEAATGEWVVTLDADTRPVAELPAAVVARACADRFDLVTVAGRFDCPTAGSRWLHPAMLTTLVYRFGPPGASASRVLANGQCMAVERSRFLASGGFAAVKGHLVEDVALARSRRAAGDSVAMLDGTDLLTVRMFESLADTWSGWGRSLALPGVERPVRQFADVAVLAVTQAFPLVRLISRLARRRRPDPLDAALVVLRLGTLAGTARAYGRTDIAYWCSPLADGPAVGRLAWGVLRPSHRWRGREYAR